MISVVWAQFLVVTAMLGVGLIWALTRGWQLTLAGFAVAPVFAGVMALQTKLVVRCEARNKKAREDVARGYYDVRFTFFLLIFFFGFNFVLCSYRLSLTSVVSDVWRLKAFSRLNSILRSTRLWLLVSKALLSKVTLLGLRVASSIWLKLFCSSLELFLSLVDCTCICKWLKC